MSVDVFGRQLTKSVFKNNIGVRGPQGEGFKLTADKQFDLNNKRLCNLADPRNSNDAVSAKIVRTMIAEETRMIYHLTSSLKDACENNSMMILGLQSAFQDHKKQESLNDDDLIYQNKNFFQLIDSRIKTLETMCKQISKVVERLDAKKIS